jgi:hypothetical protein
MNAKTKPDAQAEYRKELQRVQDQILALTNRLEARDHERQMARTPVRWDQVGSLIHVNELLREIFEFLEIPPTS